MLGNFNKVITNRIILREELFGHIKYGKMLYSDLVVASAMPNTYSLFTFPDWLIYSFFLIHICIDTIKTTIILICSNWTTFFHHASSAHRSFDYYSEYNLTSHNESLQLLINILFRLQIRKSILHYIPDLFPIVYNDFWSI